MLVLTTTVQYQGNTCSYKQQFPNSTPKSVFGVLEDGILYQYGWCPGTDMNVTHEWNKEE